MTSKPTTIPGHVYFHKWLTEEEQEKFLDNVDNLSHYTFDEYLRKEFISFHTFIATAFTWCCTPENDKYWSTLSNNRDKPLIE